MEKHELYYSKYCEHCNHILQKMNESGLHDSFMYICIDNRVMRDNVFYITLSNGTQKQLPHIINRVPVLLMKPNHELLSGYQILDFIKPQVKNVEQAKEIMEEPDTFEFGKDNSISGVISDNFSFLDMTSDELSAKGNGGIRQMYNYQSLDSNQPSIQTPILEDKKDKLAYSVEQLQQKRNQEINMN